MIMKKIVCLVLAVLLCLGMVMSCMAESEEHTHTWKEGKPATCTSVGSKICTTCGATDVIPATNHKWKDGKPATCTSAGSKICTVCGATETIPATNHKWKDGKPATCTSDGSKICTVCGATEIIPATNHSWKDGKPATCSSEGSRICTACGATENIKKLPHTEVTITGKAASCTETGLTEGKKCSVCGEITVAQKTIEKIAHTEVSIPGKDATCTETGLTEGKKCSVCGEITVAQKTIEKIAHTEVSIPGKDATCTETGLTEGKKCSVCGEVLVKQQIIPVTDHKYVSKKVPATTTSKGYTKHTCSICGDTYKDNFTDMLTTPAADPTVAPTAAPATTATDVFGSIVSNVEFSPMEYDYAFETKTVEGQEAAEDNVLVIVADPDADGNYTLRNLHLSLDLLAQLNESGVEYIRFVVGDVELSFPLSMFDGEDIALIASDLGNEMTGYVITLDNNAVNDENEAGCQVKAVLTTVDATDTEITSFLSGMTLSMDGEEIEVTDSIVYTSNN